MTKEEEKQILLDTQEQLRNIIRHVPLEAQKNIQSYIDAALENVAKLLSNTVNKP